MKNSKYDFSSIHVDVPEPLAKELEEWGKNTILDDDIFIGKEDRKLGREDEIHVTILYGLHSESPQESKKFIEGIGPITGKLGKAKIFPKIEFDVLVIEVISDDFSKLNDKLRKNVKYSNQYTEYKPHVTIAYIKKNRAWRYSGNRKWKGKKFTCDYVVFSSTNGIKTKINVD